LIFWNEDNGFITCQNPINIKEFVVAISIFDIKTHEEYLKNKQYVNINDLYKGDNALCVALSQKDYERAEWLINEGINLSGILAADTFIDVNITPEIQLLMIEKGAGFDVNQKTLMGYLPLHYSKSKEVIELLVKKGIAINMLNDFGENALFQNDDPELLTYFIEGGCDINKRNNDGRTPIFCREANITKLLIEKGARVDIKDNAGCGVITNVESREIFDLLFTAGAPIDFISNTGMNILMLNYDYNIDMDYCLSHGVDINHKNDEGINLLGILTNNEDDIKFGIYLIEEKNIDYHSIDKNNLPEKLQEYITLKERSIAEKNALNKDLAVISNIQKLNRI